MAKRKTTPIKWTDDEWQQIVKSIHSNIKSSPESASWLPLSLEGRYPLATMLTQAQALLPANRHRPTNVVQTPHRKLIISGVNAIEAAVIASLKVKEAPPQAVRQTLSLNHALPNHESRRAQATPAPVVQASAPIAAPAPAPVKTPAKLPFTFEGLGRSLDGYLRGLVNSAVDEVLPDVLGPAVTEAVATALADAVSKLPKPAAPAPVVLQAAAPMAGTTESKLLEDMLGVLEEVGTLRQQVEALRAQVGGAEPEKTHHITRETVAPAFEAPEDVRPHYAVTGAHPSQLDELRRSYANKLRLKVFADVCPSADMTIFEAIYVFEAHKSRTTIDKLYTKAGRERVHVVRGGLSSIKRELDRHVLTSQSLVAQAARSLFGQA